ncbi:sensor histidine kinase [Arthrobacter tecti]
MQATDWRTTVGRGAPKTLRARFTLSAALIVGLVLAVCAGIFYLLLQGALFAEVRAAADGDTDDLEARLGSLPAVTETDDDRFFQIISATGEVTASSMSAPGTPLGIADTDEGVILRIPEESADFLVTAEDTDDGQTIIVGRTLEDVQETLSTVGGLLAGMVPLLILIVSVVTWLVVGRALAPVELMRREVDEVTSRNLHRRIDDPGRSDEIGGLARTMNRMLERLEQSQRSQRRFISDASHELKSPLASLRQYAEVARSHPDRISADDLSKAVLDEGGRLERLVAGMLVLARADEQSLEVKAREVDLDDLMLAEGRRLRTSTELDLDATEVGAARVLGDEALLAQMVRNLVDNAAQHARSQVHLRLSTSESVAVLAVEDDGPGVPVEDRERAFERFARLDESRTRNSGGSGLGLSIVQEIVSAHHGTVQISNSLLGGVCIEVRIPSSE